MNERTPITINGTEFYVERGGMVNDPWLGRQWTDKVDTLYIVTERGDERICAVAAGDLAGAQTIAARYARG